MAVQLKLEGDSEETEICLHMGSCVWVRARVTPGLLEDNNSDVVEGEDSHGAGLLSIPRTEAHRVFDVPTGPRDGERGAVVRRQGPAGLRTERGRHRGKMVNLLRRRHIVLLQLARADGRRLT